MSTDAEYKEYHKLVRDRVVHRIEAEGNTVVWHIATRAELAEKVGNKLDEEITEFANAKNAEELIDVIEAVNKIEKQGSHARPSSDAINEWLGIMPEGSEDKDVVLDQVFVLNDVATEYIVSRTDKAFIELVIELEKLIRVTAFDRETLEAMRLKKLETHGGFENDIILDSVAKPKPA